MKHKKCTLALYQIYENDALKDYLEAMALKGWKLTKIGQLFLHFEAVEPQPVRYCVEIMEKPSAFASNQSPGLKAYREFCKDAGWDYLGSNGYLHIFCTEDRDALPVETDADERYQRICQAGGGTVIMSFFIFLVVILANLGTCISQRTFFCPAGFFILFLTGILFFSVGDYLLWKRRARASLEHSGTLPCASWKAVRFKNHTANGVTILMCAAFLFLSFRGLHDVNSTLPIILLFLGIYLMAMLFFSFLIRNLRDKHSFSRDTNLLIYWGSVFILLILTIGLISFFTFHFIL